jgi:hypothetical protein
MIEMPDRSWTPEPSTRATIRDLFRDLLRHKPAPTTAPGTSRCFAPMNAPLAPRWSTSSSSWSSAGATIGHHRHHDDREPV